jgi:hypothetical protein
MADESEQTYPFTIGGLLDKATGPEGYYGAVTPTTTPTPRDPRSRRHHRLGPEQGNPGHFGPPAAEMGGRPQRAVLRSIFDEITGTVLP